MVDPANRIGGSVECRIAIAPPVHGVVIVEALGVTNRRRHGVGKLAQRLFGNTQGHAHHHELVPQDKVTRHGLTQAGEVLEPPLKRAAFVFQVGALLR